MRDKLREKIQEQPASLILDFGSVNYIDSSGLATLVEAIRQLTGGAEQNAVPDAKVAAVSGFGIINFDRGLCSGAAILDAA